MFSSTVAFRTLVISSTDIFRVVFKLKRLDIMLMFCRVGGFLGVRGDVL